MLGLVHTAAGLPLVTAALRKTRSAFLSVALISVVTNILMLTGPLFMMQVYDRVLSSRSVPTLVALSILALGLYLFLGILEIIRGRMLGRIGERIEEELGRSAVEAALALPLRMSPKETVSQPLRDLDQVRQFMSGAGPVAICDLPWLPFYLAILYLFHPYLGWLAVAGAVILVGLTLTSEIRLRKPGRRLTQVAIARNEFLEAGRRNAEAVRAMGMRQAYLARWNRLNDVYIQGQRHAGDTTSGYATASKILRIALQSAVLALGAWLSIQQLVSPGAMIASSILTSRALAPVEQVIAQWRGFVAARQAIGRLRTVLERTHGQPRLMPLPLPKTSLSVAELTIAPPGSLQAVVQDVSFELRAGQAVGIIGPSGAGKSSLARSLAGIWQPQRGSIRLDGAEIGGWNPDVLGASIGYLPQGVELFDGTVAENIARLASEASADDVIEAAKLANVHEMILGLPDGYNTSIGTAGAVLSAGQRQRIGLARALFRKPFLIVLDEPNASLDSEGEVALTNAILSVRARGAIVVVVAHRPNALVAVDHTLVLNHGRLIAFGPRDDVLRKTTMRAVGERA